MFMVVLYGQHSKELCVCKYALDILNFKGFYPFLIADATDMFLLLSGLSFFHWKASQRRVSILKNRMSHVPER